MRSISISSVALSLALGLGVAPNAAAAQDPAPFNVPKSQFGDLGDTGVKSDPAARQGKAYGDAVAAMPDWNGVWEVTEEVAIGAFDPVTAENIHDRQEGLDFGIAPGGRMRPPYKPEVEKLYTERVQRAKADGFNDDPVSFCRAQGVPRVYATPGSVEIIVTPKVTWMIWSYFANIRRIYTDGRAHPPEDAAYPVDQGHSIGRWEGSTLVVDTVNMLAGNYDQSGAPYSDKLHMVERIQMMPNGQLKSEVTLTDPEMLSRPWTVTRWFNRVKLQPQIAAITGPGPNWADVESVHCTNNRNGADAQGSQSVQLPGDADYRKQEKSNAGK
jgi:hypothetical protein